MKLHLLPQTYAIAKTSQRPKLEEHGSALLAIIFDGKTYTWVGPQESLPAGATAERDYRALEVEGPLSFDMTGVIAAISDVLANAGVPIFVISTYDTDYILIGATAFNKAIKSLERAGHEIAR